MMQETNQTDIPPTAAPDIEVPAFSVGAALREARERAGLSVEDVANRLKFAPRQITALEQDDFANLPETAFVRGFVRSYARMLQLDEARLLAALPGAPAPAAAPVVETKQINAPFHNIYEQLQPNLGWIAGALGIVVVLVLFAVMRSEKQPEAKPALEVVTAPQVEPASAVASAVAPGTQLAEAAAPPPVFVSVPATGNGPAPTVTTAASPAAPNGAHKLHEKEKVATKPKPEAVKAPKPVPVPRPVEPVTAPGEGASAVNETAQAGVVPSPAVVPESVASAEAPAAAEPQAAKVRLNFVFDEDSWVEVKDKDGKIMLSMLGLRGHEQGLYRVPPFNVTIGHASGVRLYFKGKQVDLAPHTRTDVAHVTLE
jgi:cytoskeleton protein RodZ